jgi:hypothetical protein
LDLIRRCGSLSVRVLLALLPAAAACGGGDSRQAALVAVRFETASPDHPASRDAAVATGLDRRTAAALARLAPRAAEWERIFPVYVGEELPHAGEERPAVLGEYSLEERSVRFEPRFPFVRGQSYHALWLQPGSGEESARATLRLSSADGAGTTRVTAVYPTADELPENLLRLYVEFSAPIGREGAVERIRLVGPDGPLERPFVAPHVPLWNEAGDRLTLLLDPGRIKRGVGPHDALGAVLRQGAEYRLEVDAGMLDGEGRRLAAPFTRTFRVGPPDRLPPEPRGWALIAPRDRAGALTLEFPEPLDHALLARALRVEDAAGAMIAGQGAAGPGERSWTFRPAGAWPAGALRVIVDPALEDPAGNSVGRPFETRLGEPVPPGAQPAPVVLEFVVGAALLEIGRGEREIETSRG